MRKLLALGLFLLSATALKAQMPATCSPGTNIYYISSGIGSDANTQSQAKNKATPWAHHPYQKNFTGTYSHTAGDCFAFRGGDSWGAASFQMNVTQGGSSTSLRDYYGVDLTWFTGGSFTRPKFALGGVAPSTNGGLSGSRNVVTVSGAFTMWDNIEIVGQFIIGGHTAGNAGYDGGIFFQQGSTGNLVVNVFFHDWVTDTTNLNLGFSNGAGGLGMNGGGYTVHDSIFSDQAGSPVPMGGCFMNATGAYRNHCSYVSQGAVNFFGEGIHDNEFDHITDACCTAPYTNGIHTNVVEMLTGSANVPVYNNLSHDNNPVGVNFILCSSANAYNNVMWNTHLPAIIIDTGTGFCPGPATNTANVYNNTIVCPTGGCILVNTKTPTLGTLNAKNNHFIIDSGTAVCVNGACASAGVTNLHVSNNLQITQAQATANGYTVGTKYKAFPAAGPTSTVAFGTNLTSISTGFLANLALDPECAIWAGGGTCVARPTGTTAWDAGAYQSPGSGGGTPPTVAVTAPTAGTYSGSINITVTASGGTVSSIQPQVDGAPFGNACTSSPCTILWDTTKVGNGTHTVGGTATNGTGQGTATPVSVTINNVVAGCTTSGASWTSTSFTTQSGGFTFTITAKPNGVPPAGTGGPVIGISQSPVIAYNENAALVRQSDNGFWEVFDNNVSGYTHSGSVSWIVGTVATLTWQVDTVGQVYGVQVTQNGVTTTIGTSAAFRTPVTTLGYWNLDPATSPFTLQACNFTLGATGSLNPTSFNFGNVNVGSTASQIFTLTNNGGSPLTLTAYNISPSVFTISANGCTSPLAAGANCPLTVVFTPTAPTSYSGTLSITNSGTINSVALTGLGSSLSAPSVPGTPTATVGGSSITLNYAASTGTGPITYNIQRSTITGGPYATIATGVTATTYTDPGLANGTYYYVVSSTNPSGTSANSGQVSATISTAPQTNLSPATLNFGNVRLGGTGSLNETVSNVGTANLTLSCTVGVGITISGANSADFAVTTNGCASPVVPNSSFSLLITFTPSTTGTVEQASLNIISNAATSPDSVVLNGTGVAPLTITPTSLSFGNIYPTKTSAPQSVTVNNQSGATVNFSSIALGGSNPGDFAISSDGCSPSVANGGNCVVSVTFTPTGNGQKNATLIFTDDAAGSPQSVTLTGKGNPRVIKVGIAF